MEKENYTCATGIQTLKVSGKQYAVAVTEILSSWMFSCAIIVLTYFIISSPLFLENNQVKQKHFKMCPKAFLHCVF